MRSRPRTSSTGSTSDSSTAAYCARSRGRWAIFEAPGQTPTRLAAQLVVALDRPDDRGAAALPVEVVKPEVVGEEVGDPALERIELGKSVLAQPEQEVRAQAGLADRVRELRGEFVALVVEEVLLELIEDGVDIAAHGLRRSGEPLGQSAARLDSH